MYLAAHPTGGSMAYNSDGSWKVEDAGVASRVAAITSGSTPLMKQARTEGAQALNRRGLGNSSMAIGAAQGAAYNAAIPIASQEASQINQTNLTEMGNQADWRKTQAALAGDAQKSLTASITDLTGARYNAMANTLNNDKIPASARDSVISSINSQNQQALNFLQNIYGVNFASGGTPATVQSPVVGLGTARAA